MDYWTHPVLALYQIQFPLLTTRLSHDGWSRIKAYNIFKSENKGPKWFFLKYNKSKEFKPQTS